MKKTFFSLLLVVGMTTAASSQNIPKGIQDSAAKYFILSMQAMDCYTHDRPDGAGHDVTRQMYLALLDKYDGYRSQCLSFCKTAKQRQAYFDKVISAYHKTQH